MPNLSLTKFRKFKPKSQILFENSHDNTIGSQHADVRFSDINSRTPYIACVHLLFFIVHIELFQLTAWRSFTPKQTLYKLLTQLERYLLVHAFDNGRLNLVTKLNCMIFRAPRVPLLILVYGRLPKFIYSRWSFTVLNLVALDQTVQSAEEKSRPLKPTIFGSRGSRLTQDIFPSPGWIIVQNLVVLSQIART